ncbi:unnamed protein product [Dracunculus medinensis]|uniref:Secreted protein n=1 Tax=Dracunculus medinensis TaxID=318479 RepID=A0A0N4U366_DRAME|nr:unnamed protein product [Dracunculus medinensis]
MFAFFAVVGVLLNAVGASLFCGSNAELMIRCYNLFNMSCWMCICNNGYTLVVDQCVKNKYDALYNQMDAFIRTASQRPRNPNGTL